MNAHDEYIDDIALLSLNALSEAQAAPVRAHIKQCEACALEYRRLREVADVLPLAGVTPQTPPPAAELKRRVMAIAEQRMPTPRPRAFVLAPYLLAAACLVAAIVMGALYANVNHRVGEQNATIADLASPASERYRVIGGDVVRSGGHVYIVLRGAPPPPSGKVYQAWTLPSGSKRMAPSVTFVPKDGRILLRLPVNARKTSAVAVSAEPPGGSAQPTSKPLFVVIFKASKA